VMLAWERNMSETKTYETFPLWIPALAILVSMLSYIIGAVVLLGFGIIVALLYLVYCVGIELLVIFRRCKYCYYHHRVCGLGKGKIASAITKKGNPKKFTEREVSFADMIPDFLVAIFPLVGGVILSILDFSLIRIGLLVLILLLSFGGTAVIRGSFACNYCKQREIGCPADKLFNKKTSR